MNQIGASVDKDIIFYISNGLYMLLSMHCNIENGATEFIINIKYIL